MLGKRMQFSGIKPVWRERIVVYVAAALVVLGTLVASRFFIVQKFAAIESAAAMRTLEILRKALAAQNVEIETLSRDYARWDDMYAYVSSLDPGFAADNFSEKGLDEMNVELAWVLDANDQLVMSFDNDTDAARYSSPARAHVRIELQQLTPLIKSIRDAEGGLRLALIGGAPHILAAHSVLRSDRSGPSAGTLVLARAIRTAEIERISADAQNRADLLLLGSPRGRDLLARRPNLGASNPSIVHAASNAELDGETILHGIDGKPLAIIQTRFDRAVMQNGLRGANYLVLIVALLVSLAVTGWHFYSQRLLRSSAVARAHQARYRAVFENAPAGIVLFSRNSQVILDANPAAQRLFGAPLALLQQHRVGTLIDESIPLATVGEPNVELSQARSAVIARSDGSTVDVECIVIDIEPQSDAIRAIVLRDVSHMREAQRRSEEHQRSLQHQATHDALTGLPNRLHLSAHLPQLIADTERCGGTLTAFYIDCDHFKNINDSRGHTVGDEYLRCIAQRLRGALARSDLVVRMGGDEFLVVARHEQNDTSIEAIAQRLAQTLKQPIQIGEVSYTVTCSIGIASFPDPANSMTDLLRAADIALYEAKARGRDNIQIFDPQMSQRVQERLTLEQDLRVAIEADLIDVYLQPIVDIRSGEIVSFEALARWNHPLHGAVPPMTFIKVAEASDLIVDLGEAVLRGVARLMRDWRMAGIEPIPVAVNVSAKQLQRSNLPERILAITEKFGVPPSLIGIELTESVAMVDSAEHVAKLHALRNLGMRVSVDDFGTGYSSLSYLRNLPIDYLKIDRSFVRDMHVDGNDAAIVAAIISMAASLKLGTVAEGIETREQASQLVALGCAIGQGYHFSKPVPADKTIELLRSMRSANTARNRALQAVSA